MIPEGWIELKDVDGVYVKGNEVIICGTPEDEIHNCDEMGCGTFSHVLRRCKSEKQ